MEICKYGDTEIWRYGDMGVLRYGDMEIWRNEGPDGGIKIWKDKKIKRRKHGGLVDRWMERWKY